MSESVWDVAVVGAGPAGATAAGLLAGRGLRVLLLDAARFPRAKPCGECLNPGAGAALRRLGLTEALAALEPVALRGWRLVVGPRHCDLDYPAGRLALGADRSRLDHRLLEWAVRQGAEVAEGVRVTDLLRGQDAVTGVVTAAGRPVRARLIIGADGLRSVVARRLGLAGRGPGAPRVAFTAHWTGVEGLLGRGELHFGGQVVVGLAPVGRGEANVTVVVPARDATPDVPLLHARLGGARPAGPWLATGPFDRPVRRPAPPGILLAGDAAGYFDPLTGQGVYRALRSAELAAQAAAAILSGDISAHQQYWRLLQGEFRPRERLQRAIDWVVRWPALLDQTLDALNHWPSAGRWLLTRIGDCLETEE